MLIVHCLSGPLTFKKHFNTAILKSTFILVSVINGSAHSLYYFFLLLIFKTLSSSYFFLISLTHPAPLLLFLLLCWFLHFSSSFVLTSSPLSSVSGNYIDCFLSFLFFKGTVVCCTLFLIFQGLVSYFAAETLTVCSHYVMFPVFWKKIQYCIFHIKWVIFVHLALNQISLHLVDKH